MNKKYISELTDYTIWVNKIAINWLSQINDEQWEQQIVSSFSSVKQTALHIVSAQKVWIDYWKNVSAPVFLSVGFTGTKTDLIQIWEGVSADLKNLMDTYPEEKYLQPVTFKWPGGGEGTMEFWQSLLHMSNHSTYHRGQLVTLLRQVGFTTFSSTDLATYYRIVHNEDSLRVFAGS
ncbi:DinB family protein [Xanthocytophaga flava]|uniref:DinB family protein n=1 Tax=Xanthocytophaga flava TaxID=3048013 RepID=UPI0028D20BD4|nr:DinB family protein [Xanthocytophaga flavus]MDJ1469077.1 DinB family protein [Xanthocytophaga flavus]